MSAEDPPRTRRRRRAVGPPGATPTQEPVVDLPAEYSEEADDVERLRRDVPPHHDRGV